MINPTDETQGPALPPAAPYPRLAAYLALLPNGLVSYPECQARTSLTLALLSGIPEPRPEPSSVHELLSRFLERPPTSMWMPEVEARAIPLIVADHFEMDEGQYMRWIKAQNQSYFGSMMYRALMSFMSPEASIPKATARWAAVHRGSSMTAEFVGPRDVDIILTFPPHLFSGLVLLQISAVLEAFAQNLNARNSEVVLAEATATRGVYHARWE